MINERYELIEQVGVGGMSSVWRARDHVLGRMVAVKRLSEHLAADPTAAERFQREASAAAGLTHPGIVTVYDTGSDDEGPFIVLELIEGETLAQRLAREGALSPAVAADLTRQAAAALDHAHAHGVVHRDVKPSNLMIDPSGRVKLADFGIARVGDATTITSEIGLLGTLSYMAPEVLEGNPAGPRSDVYSLGAVTHEMLTGEPPIQAENFGLLVAAIRAGAVTPLAGIDPAIVAAVETAMSPNPADRPASAGAFAMAMIEGTTVPFRPHEATAFSDHGTAGEPTRVITSPDAVPGQDGRSPWRVLLVAGFGLVAALLVIAAALNTLDSPGVATGPSTTETVPTTPAPTTTPATVTSTSTSTSTSTTTTTTTLPADTPETIAADIRDLLAGLQPPTHKPKDVREVQDALQSVMDAWGEGDQDEMADAFEEDLFDAVEGLEDTPERQVVVERVIDLAEAMGFEVRERRGDD